MVAVVLFIAVICSFSFFAAFKLNRTFEETLPLLAMGIILILFLTGMINILGAGWIIVCLVAAVLYGYTIYWIIRGKSEVSIKDSIFNLVTPGFVVFAIISAMIAYYNQDRLAIHTDEFSHWLDTVVIMTRMDAFGTAEGSGAIFPSYPPAMSLFQYLLEKINMTVTGDFSEWKAYFAYQLLAVIVMLPFLKMKDRSLVQKLVIVISWPVCLILPLQFFKDVYSSLYIDPFLGVLGGCGFAAVSITKKKDWVYNVYMTMLAAVLVLSKDVGIYLAMFIGLYYFVDYISREGFGKKQLVWPLAPIIAMAAAKLLWKLELKVSNTGQKFSQPFNLKGTIETIQGNGNEFCTTVYTNFRNALTYRYVYYERLGFNYAAIMTLFVIGFICLHVSLYKRKQLNKSAAVSGAVIPGVVIVFYILSMFPLYISRFAEDEALNLASFDRYCGIMFLTGILLMFWTLRDMLIDADGKVIPVVLALGMLTSVYHSQKDNIVYYTSKQSVEDSQKYRYNVDLLASKINENCEDNARILVVINDGQDIIPAMLNTFSKPRVIDQSNGYFPNNTPEDGSSIISVDDLQAIITSEFDYVAVYDINECLTTNYMELFEEGNILSGSIYTYNKDAGKLELYR
ncbi:hypothetical protein [Pseudobutyrivibrio xylanivorans]|uniref:Glycosyltransferase RgtA/B/C/D-like domain-containing protein n=1 Tax=Pseudobutyrivibrio xylanivorans TaxID=185007 RepID=A0A5P6VNF8_PSEXY|nr:hypothetical protein [Pseudobutyrivibrio xylanivorans]QFJ53960.1 hypothetical protein FXF36_03285 [Pseudobutyrivibrio xylanivorans]